jgi:hypothetical protein
VRSSNEQRFPGFASFYALSDPSDRSAYHGSMGSKIDPFALTRGEWRPTNPILVKPKLEGEDLKDVIWTSSVVPLLVNRRTVKLLTQNQITGWDTYPVTVVTSDGNAVEDYVGLQVVGRCGPLIPARSGRVMKQMPGRPVEFRVGWYFDEASWDGSDIFMAENYGAKFVHERVKRCFEQAHVSNVKFRRLDEIEWRDSGQFSS